MTRRFFIERSLRQIYNGQPPDDSSVTPNLVNLWMADGTAIAAKKNYTDNFQLDGVGFVSNSFFSTFKGIAITKDEENLYKFTLPSIPLGVGATGETRILFKNGNNNLSYPAILLSEAQVGVQRGMRPIPNKILCYPEGGFAYAITPIIMTQYTATVTLISGGDATNLDSELNVPADYLPVIVEYIKAQLGFERMQKQNSANDGEDVA